MFIILQKESAGVPKRKKTNKTVLSMQRPVAPFCPTAVSLPGRSDHHIKQRGPREETDRNKVGGGDKYKMTICSG